MNPALHSIISFFQTWWVQLVSGVLIVAVVPLIAGYVVLVERKLMADMQARLGPMRVGPHGLLQPIADALKLLIKEDIIPDNADKVIFWLLDSPLSADFFLPARCRFVLSSMRKRTMASGLSSCRRWPSLFTSSLPSPKPIALPLIFPKPNPNWLPVI